jgi:hypothetical protein
MRGGIRNVAAMLVAAGVMVCANGRPATAQDGQAALRFLLFSGADLWRYGGFVYGGMLWSPAGLDQPGFTLKLLTGTGVYRYRAGILDSVEVTGRQALGSILPGWRFKVAGFEITAYAGLDLQDHRADPDDPFARLRGGHTGLRTGADLWYEPFPGAVMLAANLSVSSIGRSYWARAAAGWRLMDRVWLGPEALALGDESYRQVRLGLHATSLKTGRFEWSAGAGWVKDSDDRRGFYGRLGVLTRL